MQKLVKLISNPVPWLPRWCRGKESTYQCRRCKRFGFDPWLGKIPWSRKWQPASGFLPGEPNGQRSLASYSPWGRRVEHWLRTWAQTHNLVSQGKQQKEVMIVTKCEESRESSYMRGQPDRSGNKPAKTESGGNIILLHSPPNFFSPIKSSYCLKLPVSQWARV